jgi:hypothetical protein
VPGRRSFFLSFDDHGEHAAFLWRADKVELWSYAGSKSASADAAARAPKTGPAPSAVGALEQAKLKDIVAVPERFAQYRSQLYGKFKYAGRSLLLVNCHVEEELQAWAPALKKLVARLGAWMVGEDEERAKGQARGQAGRFIKTAAVIILGDFNWQERRKAERDRKWPILQSAARHASGAGFTMERLVHGTDAVVNQDLGLTQKLSTMSTCVKQNDDVILCSFGEVSAGVTQGAVVHGACS